MDILNSAIRNPSGFLQEYVSTAMTVGGVVAVNKFVDRGVDMILPSQLAAFRGEIVDTVKGTNMVLAVNLFI
jgi:hypothetical protein